MGFAAIPGYNYTLQSTADLTATNSWNNLSTIAGDGRVAAAALTDTNVASQSFYRLLRQPSP